MRTWLASAVVVVGGLLVGAYALVGSSGGRARESKADVRREDSPIPRSSAGAELRPAEQALVAADPRRPVLEVMERDHGDALEKHAAFADALASTGPSVEPWTKTGRELFATWHSELAIELASKVRTTSEVECFRGGCLVHYTYESKDAFFQVSDVLHDGDHLRSWPGGSIELGPRQTDAGWVSGWILLRPDEL